MVKVCRFFSFLFDKVWSCLQNKETIIAVLIADVSPITNDCDMDLEMTQANTERIVKNFVNKISDIDF